MAKRTEEKLVIKYDEHNKQVRARATVIYIDGSKGRPEAHGRTQAEARKALMAKIEQVNQRIRYGEQKQTGDISLADAVLDKIKERQEAYDRNKGREKIRDVTSDRDMDVYRYLLSPHKIAKKKINQIFPADLTDYRKFLENAKYDKCRVKDPKKHKLNMQYYSASTLNRIIRLVVEVLDEYYRYSEYKSPTTALPTFSQSVRAKDESDFLMGGEIQTALDYFDKQRQNGKYELDGIYADMFSVALMLACRPGELRGLQKRDWDAERKELTICRTGDYEDGRTKTEGAQRVLPVASDAAAILERRCKGLRNNDYIFHNTIGGTLSASNANKKLKRWLREAGIEKDLHFHSLRGSSASDMMENDVPIGVVAAIMGHEKIETTQKYYIAVSQDKKRKSLEHMAQVYQERRKRA